MNYPKNCVLFFSADWCGSCHQVQPVLEHVCRKIDVPLVVVDAEVEARLTESMSVMSLPTVIRIRDGQPRLVASGMSGKDARWFEEMLR